MSDEKKKLKTVALTDWWVFCRVHEIDAAWRVNIIRLVGLVLLLGSHWLVWLSKEGAPDEATQAAHRSLNLLAFAGAMLVASVFFALRFRVFPPLAKYVTTILDVALLTGAALVGPKTQSSLVLAYPLVIAMTYLRFSKSLVVTASISCLVGYATLLAATDNTWFDADHITPLDRQLVTISCLVLTGVVGWLLCDMTKSWFEKQEDLREQRNEQRNERTSIGGDA